MLPASGRVDRSSSTYLFIEPSRAVGGEPVVARCALRWSSSPSSRSSATRRAGRVAVVARGIVVVAVVACFSFSRASIRRAWRRVASFAGAGRAAGGWCAELTRDGALPLFPQNVYGCTCNGCDCGYEGAGGGDDDANCGTCVDTTKFDWDKHAVAGATCVPRATVELVPLSVAGDTVELCPTWIAIDTDYISAAARWVCPTRSVGLSNIARHREASVASRVRRSPLTQPRATAVEGVVARLEVASLDTTSTARHRATRAIDHARTRDTNQSTLSRRRRARRRSR